MDLDSFVMEWKFVITLGIAIVNILVNYLLNSILLVLVLVIYVITIKMWRKLKKGSSMKK